MSGCTCPTDQSHVCDDCAGMVEHLDHRAVRVCAVPTCGKPLTRKPGEREQRWKVRDYCDKACYTKLRVAGLKPSTTIPGLNEPRRCAECGGPMSRREGERANRWRGRLCCSKSCSQRFAANGGRASASASASAPAPGSGSRCARPGCETATKKPGRKYCSQRCTSLMRRTASGDARRAGQVRERARRAGGPRPAPEPVAPAAPAVPAAPVEPVVKRPAGPVWRPAGFSKVVNPWVGHRPQVSLIKASPVPAVPSRPVEARQLVSDRYGAFSVYAPQPQPSTYDSGYAHGGPDEGQAFDIPAGWDPYEVLRRYAQTANDAEEKTA